MGVALPRIHAQLMDSLVLPCSPQILSADFWEVGVGRSAEAQPCPSCEVCHRQRVFYLLLWRTGISLQRSPLTL